MPTGKPGRVQNWLARFPGYGGEVPTDLGPSSPPAQPSFRVVLVIKEAASSKAL